MLLQIVSLLSRRTLLVTARGANICHLDPDFQLHSAASKGNLGERLPVYDDHSRRSQKLYPSLALVHYALKSGQPVNSVLEGLLPLHVASSYGSEAVVNRLIEAGADVNAPVCSMSSVLSRFLYQVPTPFVVVSACHCDTIIRNMAELSWVPQVIHLSLFFQ